MKKNLTEYEISDLNYFVLFFFELNYLVQTTIKTWQR